MSKSLNNFSVENHVMNNQEWIEIDNNIISPIQLKKMITAANTKENTEDKETQNIRKRIEHRRQKFSYSSKNQSVKKQLSKDKSIQNLKSNKKLSQNQSILNELIEICIRDLLWYYLFKEKQDMKVILASEYDNIKSWVDFIIEFETDEWIDYYWLDLTLSSNEDILKKKETKITAEPLEFSIVKNWYDKGNTEIHSIPKICIQKSVLPIQPHLVQLLVAEYIDMISTEENPENIDESTITIAREDAVTRYNKEKYNFKWIYELMEKDRIVNNVQSRLFNCLSDYLW